MKSNKVYRVVRVLSCLTIIIFIFYLYLPAKENCIETMNTTVGSDHVDVLCVGSSHMGHGLNALQMYRDYGYASYEIWGGSQAPWQSYYYLKEACKYQTPSVVIIDVYKMVSDPNSYMDYQTVINLLDTPLSLNKIQTVMESVANSKLEILLRYPYIHDEYNTSDMRSIRKLYGKIDYSMGYMFENGICAEYDEIIDQNKKLDCEPIASKNEEYLIKMIEYCRQRGINPVLVNAPCPLIDEHDQKMFNYVRELVASYDVPLIDGNTILNDIGIDVNVDFCEGGHTNHSGVTKFTTYVAKYLYNNYDLPDRRGEAGFEPYEKGLEWLAECEHDYD